MPKLTINGQEIEYAAGESVIAAAARHNIEIPHYCWHPKLSVAANCRMCLVEVEKAPKLVPACQTECREGMVVRTDSARVQETGRAVHELLLLNHPIDCPICDQAGECRLQDYYMKYDLTPSRLVDSKVKKPRLERLGPYVVYNGERCIMCTRCVRFMSEVAHEPQLGIFQRGDHACIGIFPGQELNSAYSLNVVDVCPVGALTSTVFRFRQRVWNLSRGPSICSGCARGCNTHVDHRAGLVYRLLPRDNDAVNACWLCDEGRLTYRRANEERLEAPLLYDAGSRAAAPVAAEAALSEATARLLPYVRHGTGASAPTGKLSGRRGGLALALSLHTSCEEAYLLGLLARDVLEVSQIAVLDYAAGEADNVLRVADKNPNRRGVLAVLRDLGLAWVDRLELEASVHSGAVEALLCVGHEFDGLAQVAALAEKLAAVVHVTHRKTALALAAHVTLPSLAWVQGAGTWVNVAGRAQRLEPAFGAGGAARGTHVWLAQLGGLLVQAMPLPARSELVDAERWLDGSMGVLPTLRSAMEQHLACFAGAALNRVGPLGQQLNAMGVA